MSMEARAEELWQAELDDMWYYGNNYHNHHHHHPGQVDQINPQNGIASVSANSSTDEYNDDMCYQLFKLIDEDCDGWISSEELHRFLSNLGLSVAHASSHSIISDFVHGSSSNKVCLDIAQFKALHTSLFCSTHRCRDPTEGNPNNGAVNVDGNADDVPVNLDDGVKSDGNAAQPDIADDDDNSEEQLLREAFCIYDKNNDGFISASELASVLTQLRLLGNPPDNSAAYPGHLATCQAYIDRVDTNGDGLIDFDEFKRMLTHTDCVHRLEPEPATTPPTAGTLTKSISSRSSQLRENLRRISSTKLLEYAKKVNSFSSALFTVKAFFSKVLPLRRLPGILFS